MKVLPGELSPPIEIFSRKRWNLTGVEVSAGERYRFRAEGRWTDFTIQASARGYSTGEAPTISRIFLSIFEHARRLPSENWFALIGVIASDESTAFLIGEQLDDWTASRSGELMCYANDVPAACFNNRGSVILTITRIA